MLKPQRHDDNNDGQNTTNDKQKVDAVSLALQRNVQAKDKTHELSRRRINNNTTRHSAQDDTSVNLAQENVRNVKPSNTQSSTQAKNTDKSAIEEGDGTHPKYSGQLRQQPAADSLRFPSQGEGATANQTEYNRAAEGIKMNEKQEEYTKQKFAEIFFQKVAEILYKEYRL